METYEWVLMVAMERLCDQVATALDISAMVVVNALVKNSAREVVRELWYSRCSATRKIVVASTIEACGETALDVTD